MIEIRDLSIKYRGYHKETPAIEGMNLDIDTGNICTIIGPSGCGKSTLLYILAGILKDYTGDVSIDGCSIDPKVQRIGLIFQNYGLLPWKNVCQNALLGVKIKNHSRSLEEYSNYILKQLKLDGLLDRYPKELSGGQQQRVAIARSFILKPDLLLMDEPFSALDAITREEMQELFLRIWKENRVTAVFVTHSVDEALYLGQKIVVLSPSPGRVVEIIDNPCFQMDNLRTRNEYYSMSEKLRSILRKQGSPQGENSRRAV